jgi:hypothetical protein
VTNQYETKDSGERAQFESGMQRDTQAGKPRFDLTQPKGVPFEEQLLTRFALLMGRGAEKYTERNWEQASGQEELDRFLASAFRHFMQWYHGERDEDHAAAVMFNLMGYETTRYKMEQAEILATQEAVAAPFGDISYSVAWREPELPSAKAIQDAVNRMFNRGGLIH